MSLANVTSERGLQQFLSQLVNDSSRRNEIEAGFLDSAEADIAQQNEYGGVHATTQEFRDRLAESQGRPTGGSYPSQWNTTPRPFMQAAFSDMQESSSTAFVNNIKKTYNFESALGAAGLEMVSAIKKSIVGGEWAENNPQIVRMKGNATPLIDSGNMLNSVGWDFVE
jgi:hypothetical protein